MDKKSKVSFIYRLLTAEAASALLFRVWALSVFLIACLPPRCGWHTYCLLLVVPMLVLSLVMPIWRLIKIGTGFAQSESKDEKGGRHE